MRIAKNLLLVAAMLLMLLGVSQAAFDNSHHDMRSYSAGTTKEGCLQCHGRLSTAVTAGSALQLGAVGPLCLARCHSGAGIIGTSTTIQPLAPVSVNDLTYAAPAVLAGDPSIVYFSNSHGRQANLLTNGVSGASVAWPPSNANTWPYMAAANANIECTSCHAVHDNQNAPFIWAPLGPTAAGVFDGFCDRCHSESARSGVSLTGAGAAPNGNHPINFVMDNGAAATRATNGRRGRRIVVQDYSGQNIFDVPSPAASSLVGIPGAQWNLGGHVVVPGTSTQQNTAAIGVIPASGVTTAVMGCFTCHSAHRTVVNNENNLVNIATMDNAVTFNPICVGCHGNTIDRNGDMNDWRVGGQTNFGHPVGASSIYNNVTDKLYTTSIGGFKFAINSAAFTAGFYLNKEASNQMGTGGALMCTSCHQVHGGKTTTMALADIGQTTNAICKSCHNGVGIPNVHDASKGGTLGDVTTNRNNLSNAHHPTAISGAVTVNMGKAGDLGTLLAINVSPSWKGVQKVGLGDLTTGMDCADCHTFNGTAHNW